MTAPPVRHPIFSRFYGWCAAKGEKVGVAEHRDELLAGTSGRVIEVGAGSGLNFGHYPNDLTMVVAVEPEAHLRRLAKQAASRARVPIRVEEGTADHLPSPDGAFDVGVTSLVLCSVPDQAVALAELHRVIRPGGELRFYEHVRSTSPRRARLQDRADLIWPVFGGGCHPTATLRRRSQQLDSRFRSAASLTSSRASSALPLRQTSWVELGVPRWSPTGLLPP
jgi:ubiquinone/menaquinone biosynthesis C-methylase UbiE